MWWHEAYEQELLPDIIDFNDIVFLMAHLKEQQDQQTALQYQVLFIPKVFNKLDTKYMPIFWNSETMEAALEDNREPAYMNVISNSLEKKIRKFSEEKLKTLNTKAGLTNHAHSVFLIMIAYNHSAKLAAVSAAKSATKAASKSAAKSAARSAALDNLQSTSDDLGDFEMSKNAAIDCAKHFAKSTVRSASRSGKSPQEIGRLSYRVAEKITLLHYLKNFESITKGSYQEKIKEMVPGSKATVYQSIGSWNHFKAQFLEDIRDDARHFLDSWLKEIDRIVVMIEETAE